MAARSSAAASLALGVNVVTVGKIITYSKHKTAEPRSPRRGCLGLIPFKLWSDLLAVRTRLTQLPEQIALVCSGPNSLVVSMQQQIRQGVEPLSFIRLLTFL